MNWLGELLVIVFVELYFLFCGFRAGMIYREMVDKSKGGKFEVFLNALFWGFFGIYMMMYHKVFDRK